MNKQLNISECKNIINSFSMDFDTNQTYKTDIKFDNQTIKKCGEILADYIFAYIKKGGDINNLTPDNVFKN